MIILKQKPNEFIVKEILPKNFIKDTGKYYVYLLKKENMSHKEVEKIISKYAFPFFAGIKDKNAITYQYFTVDKKLPKIENLNIEFKGYSDKHLKIGDLIGNYFEIKTNFFKNYKKIQYIGTPNYFDTQRFGNIEFKEIIKNILNENYEEALINYILRNKKINKKILLEEWPNVKTYNLKHKDLILKEEFKKALKRKYKLDIKMYYRQYQSYLWNLLLKEIIKDYDYEEFEDKFFNLTKIKKEKLPLPHKDAKYKKYKNKFDKIIEKENVNINNFYKDIFGKKLPFNYRYTIFFAKKLKQQKINDKEAWLKFKLDKGCYATLVVKHLYILNNLNIKSISAISER